MYQHYAVKTGLDVHIVRCVEFLLANPSTDGLQEWITLQYLPVLISQFAEEIGGELLTYVGSGHQVLHVDGARLSGIHGIILVPIVLRAPFLAEATEGCRGTGAIQLQTQASR